MHQKRSAHSNQSLGHTCTSKDKKDPEDAEMPVPSSLTDDDLKTALLKRGVKAGPIVASTRALYERKLQKLLQSDRHKRLNEAKKAVLYSDSEEEENQEEDEESRSEKQTHDQPDKTEQESSQLSQEPVRGILRDLLLDSKTEQTGIYVTCRRPIKGAAQRPVQYAYPDSPVSPTTQRRREVERHLVPIHIQILVFLIVACVLYLLYVNVEDC